MQPKYTFYFHDNKVQYVKKNQIKTYLFSLDCLLYGQMINISKFIKELKNLFRKEKISTLIMPYIRIITPKPFYNRDKELFLMAFNALGINKIEFKTEVDYYPLKKNTTFLNILDTCIMKTTIKQEEIKTLCYPFNLFKDKKQLLKVMDDNHDNAIILFGTNQDVPEFVDILKNMGKQSVHYYNNYQTYIIEKSISS